MASGRRRWKDLEDNVHNIVSSLASVSVWHSKYHQTLMAILEVIRSIFVTLLQDSWWMPEKEGNREECFEHLVKRGKPLRYHSYGSPE
jgi:hypothetical protein